VATAFTLLEALQRFLDERRVVVETLTVEPAVALMLDWFRLQPTDALIRPASADVLVYQYGGWSEGCVTGYKLSVLRSVTETDARQTEWLAGITLMFEPSGAAEIGRFRATSSQSASLGAFLEAIQDSEGYQRLRRQRPMGVLLESGGLR
jgi:hypothetical protein